MRKKRKKEKVDYQINKGRLLDKYYQINRHAFVAGLIDTNVASWDG